MNSEDIWLIILMGVVPAIFTLLFFYIAHSVTNHKTVWLIIACIVLVISLCAWLLLAYMFALGRGWRN